MVKTNLSIAASLLMLVTTAFGACNTISYTSCADNIVHWYDPTNGEVCDPLDCGGGRAPVKYDVPCCAAYRGTEPCVSTTSTLSCWKPSSVSASGTIASASSAKTTSDTSVTDTSVAPSTGATATNSSHSTSGSTTAPSTTKAPTQSTSSATSNIGTTPTSGSNQPISTNIAGGCAGSLMAIAGAAIGAIALV
ncbi:hypothetical protein N7510_004772 [Penicillium lagena]|uniref:uncharacterized protein n=1 Tax=Penicillium lagena TaxID=94218 RepID=UPI00253FBF9B|nr:uncharacterized protein N7510_004772 [Penicillium lagena]KAJ5620788.1 hypothetical protein N7510_004772 [Penicillium lagena]